MWFLIGPITEARQIMESAGLRFLGPKPRKPYLNYLLARTL
jgi:hypothetical protein